MLEHGVQSIEIQLSLCFFTALRQKWKFEKN